MKRERFNNNWHDIWTFGNMFKALTWTVMQRVITSVTIQPMTGWRVTTKTSVTCYSIITLLYFHYILPFWPFLLKHFFEVYLYSPHQLFNQYTNIHQFLIFYSFYFINLVHCGSFLDVDNVNLTCRWMSKDIDSQLGSTYINYRYQHQKKNLHSD